MSADEAPHCAEECKAFEWHRLQVEIYRGLLTEWLTLGDPPHGGMYEIQRALRAVVLEDKTRKALGIPGPPKVG